MTWWPGWDSVDSAGFWSHFWFWVGIICLFAVGVSVMISHIYGLRKDKLMFVKMVSLAATHKAEVHEEGDTPVAEPQKVVPPKILTLGQQQTLIAALKPFAGQKVRVHSLVGSDDRLADDFIEVFRAAKWDIDPESPSHVVLAKRIFGLQPTVNPGGTDPPAFFVLVDTLAALGLGPETGFADNQTPVGIIDMKIGILGSPNWKATLYGEVFADANGKVTFFGMQFWFAFWGRWGQQARASETSQGFGRFVRSLVGLDRAAVQAAFGDLLWGATATAAQIEFINLAQTNVRPGCGSCCS